MKWSALTFKGISCKVSQKNYFSSKDRECLAVSNKTLFSVIVKNLSFFPALKSSILCYFSSFEVPKPTHDGHCFVGTGKIYRSKVLKGLNLSMEKRSIGCLLPLTLKTETYLFSFKGLITADVYDM